MLICVICGNLPPYHGNLIFEVQRKHHHSRKNLPQVVRILERGIVLVDVAETVAYLDLGRKGYKRQEEIEPDTQFITDIASFEFDHILHIAGGGVARKVGIELHTGHQVGTEIADTVGIELDMERHTHQCCRQNLVLCKRFTRFGRAEAETDRLRTSDDQLRVYPHLKMIAQTTRCEQSHGDTTTRTRFSDKNAIAIKKRLGFGKLQVGSVVPQCKTEIIRQVFMSAAIYLTLGMQVCYTAKQ